MTEKTIQQKILDLEKKIADLKAQWPAHSVKPWMLQQLDDLEDELAQLLKDAEKRHDKF